MAVLLNTSLGDIVIDLYTDQCPLTTKNFLKLCKIKYYNNCLFHTVQKDFLVQTGDPTGAGSGGDSIYKFLYGDQARFFNDEIHQNLKHDKIGVVAMASAGENLNASQFYITTRADLDYLDGKHTVFGVVGEGEEVLMKINEAFVDERNRPYKNIRIKHTFLLDDPFEDPVQLAELIPENSPALRPPAEGEEVRLEDDWVPMDEQLEPEELDKSLRRKEAHSRAVVLEMIGDIPDAEIKPPENVLFVCKLNPVTQDEDLEIIFSRFGKIISADIIRDYKTGDSLCYAFIEFDTQEACEAAYFKMDNVLIDDRRIHVDFSQSVSRLWTRYRRFGKKDMDDGKGSNFAPNSKGTGCFKCGAAGHFAKDCPEEKEKETPQERPKYKLKSAEGQRGGAATSYDMVFEDTSDLENERDDPTSSEDRMHRSKAPPAHVSHRNRDNHAPYHENRDSKMYHESDEKHHRKQRHIPGRNHESRDRVGDKRSERNTSPHDRDGRYGGSDRHKSRRDGSPEDGYFSRHHVSSSTQKRHRDSSQEDHYAHRHHDRHGRNDSSGLRSRQKEGSPKDEHPRIHRDRDGRHDLSGTTRRRTQESPERHHSGKRMEDKYSKDGKHDLSGTRSRQTQESPERHYSGKRMEDKYVASRHRSENHRHNKDRLKGEREMRDE